ncbi:MAG: hypothetical protein PVF43_13325 [Candidatus Eiseniibacteriota bacterium]
MRRCSERDRQPGRRRRDPGPEGDRGSGRDSPFGRWTPPSHDNPFGERRRRRPPRDPFAAPGASSATARGGGRAGRSSSRRGQRPLRLAVCLEIAGEGTVAHLPELPGCTFRAGNAVQVLRVAREHVVDYARWCLDEGIGDLTPQVAAVTRRVADGAIADLEAVEAERRDGAPLWLSGQPACLFRSDYEALADDAVRAHARFMRAVARRMRMRVASLTPSQRAWKPAPDRRSIDETLWHLLAMIDWLDSRLDASVPSGDDRKPSDDDRVVSDDDGPALALDGAVDKAERFLLAVPVDARRVVYQPRHAPGVDPTERWTHGKVCRRQAEHLWEHLVGLPRAIRAAAEA